MRHSIFSSSIRSFFISLFALLGIGVGMIGVVLMFAVISKATDKDLSLSSNYNVTVVPNAKNVRKKLSKAAPVILKVNIGGLIGTDELNMHTIRQQLTESREGILKKNRVKAILVHISSPGGTVVDSDGIYQALKDYKERYNIPVFAYIDGLCASGGMYVASATDKVYSSDVSLIGSVGVLSPPFFNVSQLMEKVGINALTLHAGKGKDDMNPFRPWKAGEEDSFKNLIESYYQHFVDVVASNRKQIDKTKLINEYGAQLFPADQALEKGFIDGTDVSLQDTIELLAKEIGIEDDFYQVVQMETKLWVTQLFKSRSPLSTGTVKHQIELTPELDPKMMNQFLYLYLPGK